MPNEPLPLLLAALILGLPLWLALVWRAWRRGRRRRALLWTLAGLPGLLLTLALLSLARQLDGYHRLTAERPLLTLEAHELGPRHYRLILDDGQHIRLLRLHGDQWQLDAQVLVWHPAWRLLGLDARYRIERLSGRYRDPALERHAPRSVHDLRPPTPLPAWLALPLERLPGVDTRYGSSAYMDLEDGARYQVLLTPTGLIARRLP